MSDLIRPARAASSARRSNNLWSKFGLALHPLVRIHHAEREKAIDLASYYTEHREAYRPTAETDELLRRLPGNLATFRLGYTEADLLDWLLNHTEPTLCLVGRRGSGKSTLLHYVLRHVLPTSNLDPKPLIIVVDFSNDERGLTFRDVVLEVVTRMRPLLASGAHEACDCILTLQRTLPLSSAHGDNHILAQIHELLNAFVPASRIVFAFDNCDQLPPSTVSTIYAVARRCALGPRCRSIVAMRPFSLQTQLERFGSLETHLPPTIDVPPPSLARVVRQRVSDSSISTSKSSVLLSGLLGPHVEVRDARTGIEAVLWFLDRLDLHRRVTEQLCNYDIRKALRALRALLRSRELETHIRDHLLHAADGDRHTRRARQSLLAGIMHDDYSVYVEHTNVRHNVVMNLLDIGMAPPPENAYACQYFALVIAASKGDLASQDFYYESLRGLGYPAAVASSALRRLLEFSLFESPQHELDLHRAHDLRISPCGLFYLDHLSSDEQYFIAIVPDTPMPREWSDDGAHGFRWRLSIGLNLIAAIVREEERVMTRLRTQPELAAVLELLTARPLLSQQLSHGFLVLLEQAAASTNESIKTAAQAIRKDYDAEMGRVKGNATLLESLRRWTGDPGRQYISRIQFHQDGMLEVRVPRSLDHGTPGQVSVSLHPSQPMTGRNVVVGFDIAGVTVANTEASSLVFQRVRDLKTGAVGISNPAREPIAPAGRAWIMLDGRLCAMGRIGVDDE